MLKYKSELTGRVVEIFWSDKAELYDYGEGWLSIFNDGHEEVFILQ